MKREAIIWGRTLWKLAVHDMNYDAMCAIQQHAERTLREQINQRMKDN